MTEEAEGKTSQDWYRELLETLDRLYGKGSLSDKEMKSPENHAISLARKTDVTPSTAYAGNCNKLCAV